MRHVKHLLMSLALIFCMLFSMVGCNFLKGKFTVYACGSAITFNRGEHAKYKIKELDIKFKGNSYYFEDYFYSEELGEKYTIRKGLAKVGEIYLAKKSDYFGDEVHRIHIDTYSSDVLSITPDMGRVHILSKSGKAKELIIAIEDRDYPLDITFENVHIYTKSALPVFFSGTYSDLNINLIGDNSFSAGSLEERSETLSDKLENGLTNMENFFTDIYDGTLDVVNEIPDYFDNKNVTDVLSDQLLHIGKTSANIFEGMLDGWMSMWTGSDGITGRDGVTCFFHLGGVSLSGDGKITITGGKGGRGGNAKDSIMGMANGGNGGSGGIGLVAARYLDFCTDNLIQGGSGGSGGDPSDAFFGLGTSSGERGRSGATGLSKKIADSWDK